MPLMPCASSREGRIVRAAGASSRAVGRHVRRSPSPYLDPRVVKFVAKKKKSLKTKPGPSESRMPLVLCASSREGVVRAAGGASSRGRSPRAALVGGREVHRLAVPTAEAKVQHLQGSGRGCHEARGGGVASTSSKIVGREEE